MNRLLEPLAPGSEIGIVGDGQLGRMLTVEALKLGYDVRAVGPEGEHSPAGQVGAVSLHGSIASPFDVFALAASDVVTIEVEHVSTDGLRDIEDTDIQSHPSPETIDTIKDKYRQKEYLRRNGIPVGPYMAIDTAGAFSLAQTSFGKNLVVKSRTGGFDGRGNFNADENTAWADVLDRFTDKSTLSRPDLYVEQALAFERELSAVGVRDQLGNVTMYPVVETIHKDNICKTVMAPATAVDGSDPKVILEAEEIGRQTIGLFEGAGVFAVEMFVVDGQVFVNEVAPRVHNSAHWTILGAETNQFENHIRAVAGLPIGRTAMKFPVVAMVNLIGEIEGPRVGYRSPDKEPDVFDQYVSAVDHRREVNLYGKTSWPKRKLGHVSAAHREGEMTRAVRKANGVVTSLLIEIERASELQQ